MENVLLSISIFVLFVTVFYFSKNKIGQIFQINPNTPLLAYKKTKNAYATLVNLLYHNSDKENLEKKIDRILLERSDGRYISQDSKKNNQFNTTSFSLDSFYDLLRYLEKKEESFILDLDKNISLKAVNMFFKDALGETVEDTNFFRYNPPQYSFPYRQVLVKYQEVLKKKSIQIGMFTDTSGFYYLFLFPMEEESTVRKAISDIGFECQKIVTKEHHEKLSNTAVVTSVSTLNGKEASRI